jgi:hypothetical protein
VIRFAEVKFFFVKTFGGESRALVLVSLYSPPDGYLLRFTHDTLVACGYQGEQALVVINAKAILAVVAMVPFPFIVGGRGNLHYMIEKMGVDVIDTDDTGDDEQA